MALMNSKNSTPGPGLEGFDWTAMNSVYFDVNDILADDQVKCLFEQFE